MEKHYSIDPGLGSKMDGCPYSTFEDGRDVEDYIIPPKGYEFVGFKLEPLPNNQVYDGKLVAQYEKTSIRDRLTMNIWKILIPVIIVAVIALVAVLAIGIFKEPRSPRPQPKTPKTETVVTPIDTIAPQIVDTVPSTDTIVPEDNGVILDLTEQFDQQGETQTVEETQETPQPAEEDPNVQFKQAFWDLIHEGVIMMDAYHDLYVNYKDKVEGEEFDYLRLTILKDYVSFKEWYEKLRKIPAEERRSLQNINALVLKLNEIEQNQ